MSASKTGKMVAAAGLALYGAGCFVQPGPAARPVLENMPVAQVSLQEQAAALDDTVGSAASWQGLAAGAALGLLVGIAGGIQPAKATGGPFTTGMQLGNVLECNIHKGCTGEKLEKWAKEMLAKEEKQSMYTVDPALYQPSTGAGFYKQYNLDLASPMKGNGLDKPGYGTDGRYFINERKHPWIGRFEYSKSDEEVLKQAEPILGKKGFSWTNSPYKWDKSVWDK
eukprot:TRINITY_DN3271_c0_g1_i8.p1 TRINITY_DN3271_c0_g1~~TRINITY_DN3271_c0_g1_i8.p1  ORF type:complete len:225 (+),score=82.20 TRINITY_DN3271_c0_g1_i8:690-1364(+)